MSSDHRNDDTDVEDARRTARLHAARATARMNFANIAATLGERYGQRAQEQGPGHWMFEVVTDRKRSQVVHLILKEYETDGVDLSRIVIDSPIGPLPGRTDYESLLRRNAELHVGAICIEDFREEDNDLVAYLTLRASHLLETADEEEVWNMVEFVADAADRLEKDIYAHDVH